MSIDPSQLEVQYVRLDALHPNPWNPNRMDDRTYKAERESIQTYGFVDPITVRPDPDTLGEFQILDGEHRFRAAADEGIEVLPIVVLPLDDAQAKKLTIILNETRGEADPVSLAVLLKELNDEIGAIDLALGLPYTAREMEEFLQIGEVDWDQFDASHAEKIEEIVSKRSGGQPRFLHFTKEEAKHFDDLIGIIQREREIERVEDAVLYAIREVASKF